MYFKILILIAGMMIGEMIGFKRGVESVDHNRYMANEKLQQCLRIIRS